MNRINTRSRLRGCLLGLAVGDAIGAAAEFRPRGSFPPLTNLVGGGVFNLPAGARTDHPSMALCLATSLVECRGFDTADQMERHRQSPLGSVPGDPLNWRRFPSPIRRAGRVHRASLAYGESSENQGIKEQR